MIEKLDILKHPHHSVDGTPYNIINKRIPQKPFIDLGTCAETLYPQTVNEERIKLGIQNSEDITTKRGPNWWLVQLKDSKIDSDELENLNSGWGKTVRAFGCKDGLLGDDFKKLIYTDTFRKELKETNNSSILLRKTKTNNPLINGFELNKSIFGNKFSDSISNPKMFFWNVDTEEGIKKLFEILKKHYSIPSNQLKKYFYMLRNI